MHFFTYVYLRNVLNTRQINEFTCSEHYARKKNASLKKSLYL